MPQDKGTPQPPASKGKDRTQPTPSKSDPRRMYAPPAPEPPADYGGPPDESPPDTGYGSPPPPSGYGSESDSYGGGGGGEPPPEGDYDEAPTGGGYGAETTPDDSGYGTPGDSDAPGYSTGGGGYDDGSGEEEDGLRERVAEAQRLLREAEAELAKHQQHAKLLESITAIVADYAAQYPGLSATERKLREYRAAEEKCLVQILGEDCAAQIPDIVERCREAIRRLEQQVKAQEESLVRCRLELETAKLEAARAKAAFDELIKPAASVAARLKAVEAFRAEVAVAHNAGEYAVAYWLLTDAEKLDGKLNGEPQVYRPEDLKARIEQAWDESANASHRVEAIDADIKTREQILKSDKAELAERIKTFGDRIRLKLSQLEPHHAAAA